MLYKPDWEKVQERFRAWWNCELVDRCCIQVYAPRGSQPTVREPDDLESWWTDMEWRVAAAEDGMRRTYYGGEAFPIFYPNLGPDVFAAWFGAEMVYKDRTTSWSVPLVKDWAEFDQKVKLDKTAKWWSLIEEGTRLGIERGAGRFIVGLTDIHGGGDALAAFRDPMVLNLDCIEHPDEVRRAMKFVEKVWPDIYMHFYNITRPHQLGTSTWLQAWSPGKYYPGSCDFICMVSPKMFREFFLDELVAECNWLDHSLFHLDGPGALKHLDDLLAIPTLNGIQWVPGANSGPATQWIALLKRIQAAGKCIHFSVPANEIKPLMEALSSKGLMLATSVSSIEEAEALIRQVATLTHE